LLKDQNHDNVVRSLMLFFRNVDPKRVDFAANKLISEYPFFNTIVDKNH
jgi:hypothetical protein